MKLHRLFLAAATLVAGCHAPPPEGVYPCTTNADCFPMWTCRADLHCWSQPLPDAGIADAGCVPETCNGRDDDCDSVVDEGVLTVGPAVPANPMPDPQPAFDGAILAPLTTGFAVLGTGYDTGAGGWSTIDASGTVTTSVPSTGQTYFFDLATFGDQVVASGIGYPAVGNAGLGLVMFDFAHGPTAQNFLPIGGGADDLRISALMGFDGRIAHVYELGSAATGTFIRRAHVDTTVPSVVTDDLIASDLNSDVAMLHTAADDYLVFTNIANELQLFRDDPPRTLQPLGVITMSYRRANGTRLGIRDGQRPVSSTNPILLIWADWNGVVSFVEITDVVDSTTFALSPIRTLTGTRGPASPGLFPMPGIAIVPAPFDSSSDPPHWIVAILGNDGGSPALSILQVFDITESTIDEITVPNESYAHRSEVSVAVSNGHIRLAEAGNAGGIVTRAIGCE
jgi:hypothetical protein